MLTTSGYPTVQAVLRDQLVPVGLEVQPDLVVPLGLRVREDPGHNIHGRLQYLWRAVDQDGDVITSPFSQGAIGAQPNASSGSY